MPARIRVLLAEDHVVVREGLRALLAGAGAFEVVGQASSGREALALARELEPDVVLLDIALPEMDGIEATRRIAEEAPASRVVILSMHRDEDMVSAAFAAGATGYVVKDEPGEELIGAIREVAAGELHVSPLATRALVQSVRGLATEAQPGQAAVPEPASAEAGGRRRRPGRRRTRSSPLSPRETEVLKLVAGGLSTKQVAYELNISPKTADAHRQAIMRKLDIHDVAGLVKYALREGHIELG